MNSSFLNIDSPVHQFVNEFPKSAPILQSLGIDFCCEGQKSLAEACAEKGLDPNQLLKKLCGSDTGKTPDNDRDWTEATLTELVERLESTHHVYVKKALPCLIDLMTRVVGAHGERHPEALQLDGLVRGVVADMGPHMMKEERILFPAMKKLDVSQEGFHCGSIQNPIRVMKADHDNLGKLLSAIREQTRDFALPEDACEIWRALYEGLKEFEKDTLLHIHRENNILFPMAIKAEQGV